MSGQIRLGCLYCDRTDFDGIDALPDDWEDIGEVQSYEEAVREVALDDHSRCVLNWETHTGVCPECAKVHNQREQ